MIPDVIGRLLPPSAVLVQVPCDQLPNRRISGVSPRHPIVWKRSKRKSSEWTVAVEYLCSDYKLDQGVLLVATRSRSQDAKALVETDEDRRVKG